MTDDELLVGVTVDANGRRDYSHAAVMSKEVKISDPIVDRLRGPLLIDEEKEEKYIRFQKEMASKSETGEDKTWFIEMMNKLKLPDAPEITLDDVQSLKFVQEPPELQDIKDQYGFNYSRSYFQMSLAEYKTVYARLTGRMDSNGSHLQGSYLETDSLTKDIGLTVAPSLGPDIVHELEHTIDPNLEKRTPSDRVLEEVAVYYRETYIPRVYTQTTRSSDGQGNYSEPVVTERRVFSSPDKIGNILKDDLYSSKYSKAFSSVESYEERIGAIIEVVKGLEQYMKKEDVNKAIYNATSFYELSHLRDVLVMENRK